MATTTAKKIRFARDQGGDPIQGALFPKATVVIAFTNTAAKNADEIVAQVVRLVATQDCYVKIHDLSDAMAGIVTDMLLKANLAEYFTMNGKKYISAIRVISSGNLFVTVME